MKYREFKFRAWDSYHQEMINWSQYKDELVSEDFINHGKGPLVVMQYTGLKDKNGVEIYEGDLFRLEFDNGEYLCSVEFCEEEVGYVSMPKKTFKEKYGELLWVRGNEHFNNNEIIGNIYENPELLAQII